MGGDSLTVPSSWFEAKTTGGFDRSFDETVRRAQNESVRDLPGGIDRELEEHGTFVECRGWEVRSLGLNWKGYFLRGAYHHFRFGRVASHQYRRPVYSHDESP